MQYFLIRGPNIEMRPTPLDYVMKEYKINIKIRINILK